MTIKLKQVINQNGGMLMLVLVFTSLFVVVVGGLVSLAVSQNKLGLKNLAQEKSIQIAEAGINYYRWHLAHAPDDYQDGTGAPGSYVHTYADPYGTDIGEFELLITPNISCTYDVPGIIIEGEDMTPDNCVCETNTGPPDHHIIKYPPMPPFGIGAFLHQENVNFPTTDTYTFTIYAKADFDMTWPRIRLQIDDADVAQFDITSSSWQTYSTNLSISAGDHKVSIKHTSNNPGSGRFVYIDHIDVAGPSLPGTTVNESHQVAINSTGSTFAEPGIERVIEVIYGRPSLANFAFLTNSNVWFGDTEELHGPVHSNGGIRMDGTQDSLLTSAKETYICGAEHGCSGETKPGIWGAGGIPSLWDFPVPVIDFNQITADMANLKTLAQDSGIYIAQQGLGFHVNFLADGTFDLYRVMQLENPIWGFDGDDWVRESWDIKNESFVQNYALPSTCSIIFIEDNVWVDGVVNGQATLVAGRLPEVPNNNRNIILNGDITYLDYSGDHILGLIAQQDILVPLYSAPLDLEIDAALLAQKGHVFRYYYPNWYSPYHIRDTITLRGVIISNTTWTWSWVNGSGTIISGYDNTNTIYDPNLKFNPPPGFPTESEYDFIKWEEVN